MVTIISLYWLGQAQAAPIIFDRGLPSTNLNSSSNPVATTRSNAAWAYGPYQTANPPTQYTIPGDDFSIGSVGTSYNITTVRLWVIYGGLNSMVTPTGLNLYEGKWADGPSGISLASSSFAAQRVYYDTSTNYVRWQDGVGRKIWEIDFTVNLTVEGGLKYWFFLDGLYQNQTDGYYYSYSLAASNSQYGGVTADGADNLLRKLTVDTGGGGFTVVQQVDWDSQGFTDSGKNFPNSTDANIQLEGFQVPLPSTLLLFGSGFLGLVGWRRFRKG